MANTSVFFPLLSTISLLLLIWSMREMIALFLLFTMNTMITDEEEDVHPPHHHHNHHHHHQHHQSPFTTDSWDNLHLRKLYLQCWLFNGIDPWAVLSKLLLSLNRDLKKTTKFNGTNWIRMGYDNTSHVIAHLLKSFRAYNVTSSSTLFSENIQ